VTIEGDITIRVMAGVGRWRITKKLTLAQLKKYRAKVRAFSQPFTQRRSRTLMGGWPQSTTDAVNAGFINYLESMVEAVGVEPTSENVTGQEPTYLVAFARRELPRHFRARRSERTRNARR